LSRDGTVRPEASVVVFFVDGFDLVQFERLLADGNLPNIRRQFVEGGVGVRSAIASMPSITYANSTSIITGRFPGHHGILGNEWFDRSACLLRDYGLALTYRAVNDDFDAPTLYDLLHDELTVSVQAHTRRGVDISIDNAIQSGIDWLRENYSDVDARVGRQFSRVAAAARRAGRWPVVYFNYFPGLDEAGHFYGSDSLGYTKGLITVDAAIGQIIADVEAADIAERRYYVLLSDHGHVPLDPAKAFPLADWLAEQHNRRVRVDACQTGAQFGRCRVLDGYDTVVLTGASRAAAIHLRGPGGWHEPPAQATIDGLIGAPGAEGNGLIHRPEVLVACTRAGNNVVCVVSRNGTARIERRVEAGEKRYRLIMLNPWSADAEIPARRDRSNGRENGLSFLFSRDPKGSALVSKPTALGYAPDAELAAFIDAGWHDSRSWLNATAHTDLPDFVPQVVEMFDSPRAGDIVVFASESAGFEPKWRGGHGSCLARDMRVPLYFAGPDLSAGAQIDAARLVDVMSTVLDMLGCANRLEGVPAIDGVSLLPELRAARSLTVAARIEHDAARSLEVAARSDDAD
jgi:hypothetical protein